MVHIYLKHLQTSYDRCKGNFKWWLSGVLAKPFRSRGFGRGDLESRAPLMAEGCKYNIHASCRSGWARQIVLLRKKDK
ncbi:uncharacterized protein LOC120288105 isoform X2 [Eucalyptus grandis]|uniref:uncharacterized protein LOC120288105 isoform X2 n=1 Tax=Eucalyptus grandis TaxID=71139 RepID=UPI00192ECF31|nr:uncharacterized protein LOC120288105 isoform X2 [Eucalyptus grandis]